MQCGVTPNQSMGTREEPLSNYFDLQRYGRPAFVHVLTMICRSAVFLNDTVTVCLVRQVCSDCLNIICGVACYVYLLIFLFYNSALFFNNLAVINQIGYKTRTVGSGIYGFTFLYYEVIQGDL